MGGTGSAPAVLDGQGVDTALRARMGVLTDGDGVESDFFAELDHDTSAKKNNLSIDGFAGSGKTTLTRELLLGFAESSNPARTTIVTVDCRDGGTFDLFGGIASRQYIGDDGTIPLDFFKWISAEIETRDRFLIAQQAKDFVDAVREHPDAWCLSRIIVAVSGLSSGGLQYLWDVMRLSKPLGIHYLVEYDPAASYRGDDLEFAVFGNGIRAHLCNGRDDAGRIAPFIDPDTQSRYSIDALRLQEFDAITYLPDEDRFVVVHRPIPDADLLAAHASRIRHRYAEAAGAREWMAESLRARDALNSALGVTAAGPLVKLIDRFCPQDVRRVQPGVFAASRFDDQADLIVITGRDEEHLDQAALVVRRVAGKFWCGGWFGRTVAAPVVLGSDADESVERTRALLRSIRPRASVIRGLLVMSGWHLEQILDGDPLCVSAVLDTLAEAVVDPVDRMRVILAATPDQFSAVEVASPKFAALAREHVGLGAI